MKIFCKIQKILKRSLDLYEGLNYSDIIFIMVQTPNSGGNKFYDHSIVSNLLQKINEKKVENKHIIIGCTLMPKYIDEVGLFLLSDCKNTTLSYNLNLLLKEKLLPHYLNPDMVLITHSQKLGEILQLINSL